ncbi:MAG: hypothetical protein CBE36_03045 [Oceanospirillaceae bacterium TMED276]|nr:MAG: hypothetical protein CBE36_03045 [Oceanospirillaceae bacterium TMED276]
MKNPRILPAFCLFFLLVAGPGIADTTNKIRTHQTLEAAVLNQNLPLEGEPAEFGKNRTLRFSGQP